MKKIIANKLSALSLLLCIPFFAACEPKKEDPPEPVDIYATPCGPRQEMPGRNPVWIYYQCDEAETMWIDQSTISRDGVPLGPLNVGRGMMSVKYRGLHNDIINEFENFGIIFMANGLNRDVDEDGFAEPCEVNWQWMAHKIDVNWIMQRLIMQRFDGTCGDPNRGQFCEEQYVTDEIQFNNREEIIQFDCRWDWQEGPDGIIWCDITKPGDPTFWVSMYNWPMGPYNSLRYIGVGNEAFKGPGYFSFDAPVHDFKVTFFD